MEARKNKESWGWEECGLLCSSRRPLGTWSFLSPCTDCPTLISGAQYKSTPECASEIRISRSETGQSHVSSSSGTPLPVCSPSHLVLVWGLRRKHGGKAEGGAGSADGRKSTEGNSHKRRICWNRWRVKRNPSDTCFFSDPSGMFCGSQGLTQPSGLCHSGHYCTGGAVSPTPIQHKVGNTGPQQSRVYGLGTTTLPGSPSFPV